MERASYRDVPPKSESGCGNDGPRKKGETDNRFPPFFTVLGNRYAIPTFPQPRRLTCFFSSNLPEQFGGYTSSIQVHNSVRNVWPAQFLTPDWKYNSALGLFRVNRYHKLVIAGSNIRNSDIDLVEARGDQP